MLCDKAIGEVETTKFIGLQIGTNLNWKKSVLYSWTKLSTVCRDDAHITHENRKFKISFISLFTFHHVME
jgi:hypothetical protein